MTKKPQHPKHIHRARENKLSIRSRQAMSTSISRKPVNLSTPPWTKSAYRRDADV